MAGEQKTGLPPDPLEIKRNSVVERLRRICLREFGDSITDPETGLPKTAELSYMDVSKGELGTGEALVSIKPINRESDLKRPDLAEPVDINMALGFVVTRRFWKDGEGAPRHMATEVFTADNEMHYKLNGTKGDVLGMETALDESIDPDMLKIIRAA